jgi:glyoxylase-like metal-dependent hydrolase (beta-lactamase superfamily II)
MAAFDNLQSPFLASLATAGVTPADVDVVINTHVHIDHVGWNTMLDGGQWIPTFPNARYVMSAVDVDFWNPAHSYQRRGEQANENMFTDSVAPVLEAGLVEQWTDHLVLDENLTIDLAPGHTPGLGVITLSSGTDRAVFVGDLLHSPVQVLDPFSNSCFCENPAEAVRSRQRVLGWAADNNALLLPAHFCGGNAVEIARDGDKFRITGWAGFTDS